MESFGISLGEVGYPERLRHLCYPPKEIYVKGNIGLLKEKRVVAVVGSRQMHSWGMRYISKLIPDLVKTGVVIVSGMAIGSDAWAQKTCLEAGGKTIAVLASGCDLPTPNCNKWLYERILAHEGLIVSLKPGNQRPEAEDFLKRNEIVSGLADMVVVIEGGEHSGTLVTARLAAEQGKEVGAVRGPTGHENSAATEYLLRNGAIFVEDSADILNALV